jgi:drug/metabolite transporter (DMT)-like permease
MPHLVLFTSLIVLSQSGIFIRIADTHASAIGLWRMLLALPVLAIFLLRRNHVFTLKKIQKTQWLLLALCGFFLFSHFYTWFLSVQKTSLAHSMILFCTNPLFTAIGAWILFNDKVSFRHGIAMLFCFVGIYLLLSDKSGRTNLEGDLLGIACSILFSFYVLTGKGLRAKLPNVPFAFVTYSFCALFFLLLVLGQGVPLLDYPANSWWAFAALAFGSTLLGHSLFTYSLQYFHVNVLSISTLVEPALTAFSGYLLFQEAVTLAGMWGFACVGIGIFSLYIPFFQKRRYFFK